jgi:5-methylcytosine-specific restriction endonuclease McrA
MHGELLFGEPVPGEPRSGERRSSEPLPGETPYDERPGSEHAPGHVDPPPPEERYLLRLTIEKSTRDKLHYAQALLSHVVRADDVAQVLDRALDSLIAKLEKQKLGSAARRSRRKAKTGKRYVPPEVRQVVWQRDGGQCTFVSAKGHRCTARRLLEFDHVQPVARGGTATVEAMRLRCRAHNQYEAERAFGSEFMSRRKDARRATSGAGTTAPTPAPRTGSRTAPGTPGTPPPRHDAGTIVSPP